MELFSSANYIPGNDDTFAVSRDSSGHLNLLFYGYLLFGLLWVFNFPFPYIGETEGYRDTTKNGFSRVKFFAAI